MKTLQEWINNTDVKDSYSDLLHVYWDVLGIEVIRQDGFSEANVLYVVKDPKKIPFSHQFGRGFILDPEYDLPDLLEQFFIHTLQKADATYIGKLIQDMDANRLRQSLFEETTVEYEFKAGVVNVFFEQLYRVALRRQRQLVKEQHVSTIDTMDDILFSQDTDSMHFKVLGFYENVLGIKLYKQFSDDEEEQQMVFAVSDGYKKLKAQHIVLKEKPNLDGDDLGYVLETYFHTMLEALDFADLLKYGSRVKALNDSFSYIDQNEQRLGQYISHLQDGIKIRLRSEIDSILQQAEIPLPELVLIINHLDLLTEQEPDDIDVYLDSIANASARAIEECRPRDELRAVIKEQKISKLFSGIEKRTMLGLEHALEPSTLQAYVVLMNAKNPQLNKISEKLAVSVGLSLIDLLTKYQEDVNSSISDRNKKQKLNSIAAMLTCLNNTKQPFSQRMVAVKAIFDKNPQIHQSESIGRYLYRCICTLLDIPYQAPNYHMTLFHGLSAEKEESLGNNESRFKPGYKSLD